MRIALPLVLALIASAACAEEAPFLFDVLRKPAYSGPWEKLMKDVQPTPDWLMQFNKNFDGEAGPMTALTIEGKPYELYFVCKPHACAARKFEVLFDVAGKRAFGALGGGEFLVAAVVAAVFDEFLGGGEVDLWGLPRVTFLAEQEAGAVKVNVGQVQPHRSAPGNATQPVDVVKNAFR